MGGELYLIAKLTSASLSQNHDMIHGDIFGSKSFFGRKFCHFAKVNFEKEKKKSPPPPPPPTLFLQCEMCFLSPFLCPCTPPPPPPLSLSLFRSLQLSSLQANAEAACVRIKKPRRGRPGISLFLCNLKTRFTCLAVFDI
jgi:hypothetical protein